jgi:hypothetical protein
VNTPKRVPVRDRETVFAGLFDFLQSDVTIQSRA